MELDQLLGNFAAARPPATANPRDAYVRWTTDAELRLRTILHPEDAREFFSRDRHRDVCTMPLGNQLMFLLNAELDALRHDLTDAVGYLKRHRDRMRAGAGFPIVVDTMVLLQSQRLDQVKWAPVVGDEARVMVPLRVIEEIEDKKYSDSKRLRKRARGLLPWIDHRFPEDFSGPVPLTEHATIELILAERPRYRPNSADDEILEVAQDVLQFAGRVKVLTGDTGMRGRARAEGLDLLPLPDDWQLPADDDD
jgi:rRNA-processing protein FCF1